MLESIEGAPLERLSLREWNPRKYVHASRMPVCGYPLVEDLAAGLDIRTQTPVERIAYSDQEVVVDTGSEAFRGDPGCRAARGAALWLTAV